MNLEKHGDVHAFDPYFEQSNTKRNISRNSSCYEPSEYENEETEASEVSTEITEAESESHNSHAAGFSLQLPTLLQEVRVWGWVEELTHSAKFQTAMLVLVLSHIFLSIFELILVYTALLIGASQNQHQYIGFLYIPVLINIIIMGIFLSEIIIRGVVSENGLIKHFCVLNKFLDLLVMVISIVLGLVGLIVKELMKYTTLTVVIFRLCIAFRIENAINREVQRQINQLDVHYQNYCREGRGLCKEIRKYVKMIEESQNELTNISDKLLQAKHTSWSSLVPLGLATSLSISRAGSTMSKQSVNSRRHSVSLTINGSIIDISDRRLSHFPSNTSLMSNNSNRGSSTSRLESILKTIQEEKIMSAHLFLCRDNISQLENKKSFSAIKTKPLVSHQEKKKEITLTQDSQDSDSEDTTIDSSD